MKIIKNNIKLVIGLIIGVLISSGVVYALSISGSNVTFNNAGVSGATATNVQGAIEELYGKAANAGPTCAVKMGDYVSLTPTKTSYTIKTSLTGYDFDQTINPSELNLWRVIDIHSDGSFDAVSEYVSTTSVYFKGTTGYANFVGALNTIAAQYQVPGYTIGSRHMGYGGQTSIIGDTSLFDGTSNTAPETTSTEAPTSGTGEEFGNGVLGDTLYLNDYNLSSIYTQDNNETNYCSSGLCAYKKGTTTKTAYWIGSRLFYYDSATFFLYDGRRVSASGTLSYYDLRYYNDGWDDYTDGSAVRPILTLKSGITTNGGTGAKDNPYTLS